MKSRLTFNKMNFMFLSHAKTSLLTSHTQVLWLEESSVKPGGQEMGCSIKDVEICIR